MTFTDKELIFSLLIFATVISVAPRRFVSIISVISLFVFLTVYSPYALVVFSITSIMTFFIFKFGRNSFLISGILFLLFVFSVYKIPQLFNIDNPLLAWGYPIGLSYFMVRNIHFLFETYKENISSVRFIDFISFTGFFPAYFTGPIHRFPQFMDDLHNNSFSKANLSAGLERILYGYVKIVFLANFLVSTYFAFRVTGFQDSNPALFHYLDCIRYGANLYFLFAGYSDIAIGVSLVAGFRLTENFNYPFLANNISDFWKRWHISLSEWCRDYVFKPIFAQTRIFPLSIMATMLAIGLWHEFTARYVVWAVYHGIGIAVWQYFDKHKIFRIGGDSVAVKSVVRFFSVIITLHFVIFSFAVTKEDSIGNSWIVFKTIFSLIF
jgi:alginate O-acetyltransferase complex protein AlgI